MEQQIKVQLQVLPRYLMPGRSIVSGPSSSGKTTLLHYIITNKLISPWPERQFWITEVEVPKAMQIQGITYVTGVPPLSFFESLRNAMVVLDDLQHVASDSDTISALFRRLSHHNQLSVFLLVQNLSFQGRRALDSRRNADYFFLFRNPSDAEQYKRFQTKLGLHRKTASLNDLIAHVSRSNPHYCLVVDLKFGTPDHCRFRADPRYNERRQIYFAVHNLHSIMFP